MFKVTKRIFCRFIPVNNMCQIIQMQTHKNLNIKKNGLTFFFKINGSYVESIFFCVLKTKIQLNYLLYTFSFFQFVLRFFLWSLSRVPEKVLATRIFTPRELNIANRSASDNDVLH